jgi:NAD kinase
MRSTSKFDANVTLGDDTAVIRRTGHSRPEVAKILGVERDASGQIVTVWLDRLVHRVGETEYMEWQVSGAVSTVLRRDNKHT